MHKDLVTCTVLTYNNFKYIYEALDSIFAQDYQSIELIIADDGTKDFPKEEIELYVKTNKKENIKNVIIYTNDKNMGTVKNLNKAHKMANGTYLIGLSCDDVFFENNVMSKVVDRFEKTGVELISCNSIKCEQDSLNTIGYMFDKDKMNMIKENNTAEKQYKLVAHGNFIASGSSTYHTKKSLENNGYWDEDYILLEDAPYFAKYTRDGNMIYYADDIIAIKYRVGGVSTGKNKTISKKLQDDIVLYYKKEINPYLKRLDFFERRKVKRLILCIEQCKNKTVTYIKRCIFFPDLEVVAYTRKFLECVRRKSKCR